MKKLLCSFAVTALLGTCVGNAMTLSTKITELRKKKQQELVLNFANIVLQKLEEQREDARQSATPEIIPMINQAHSFFFTMLTNPSAQIKRAKLRFSELEKRSIDYDNALRKLNLQNLSLKTYPAEYRNRDWLKGDKPGTIYFTDLLDEAIVAIENAPLRALRPEPSNRPTATDPTDWMIQQQDIPMTISQ